MPKEPPVSYPTIESPCSACLRYAVHQGLDIVVFMCVFKLVFCFGFQGPVEQIQSTVRPLRNSPKQGASPLLTHSAAFPKTLEDAEAEVFNFQLGNGGYFEAQDEYDIGNTLRGFNNDKSEYNVPLSSPPCLLHTVFHPCSWCLCPSKRLLTRQ